MSLIPNIELGHNFGQIIKILVKYQQLYGYPLNEIKVSRPPHLEQWLQKRTESPYTIQKKL